MIDLDFAVERVSIAPRSATPILLFRLRVANRTPQVPVENVQLQAQIRIEATHRNYNSCERDRLVELFGLAADWDRTLRDVFWTNAGVSVPGFSDTCAVDLPVPCSYDFDIAATKYFFGVGQGEVPLLLLFSGTIFSRNADGELQIGQVAHHKEAGCRLPAGLWRSLMEQYYADRVWLRIGRDVFEQLNAYKRRSGLTGVEEALQRLLADRLAQVPR